MDTLEIVHQLRAVLPKYSNDFSDNITITNIAVNGANVTFTTSANHHLKAGDTFLTSDIENYIVISSLKKYNSIAIAFCQDFHNVTFANGQKVKISGASDSKYNGNKELSLDTLSFKVASIALNYDNTATITTTNPNPFIVNPKYLIQINGASIPIKSITNSTTFVIDNFIGIGADSDITEIKLSTSLNLFFYNIDSTAIDNPTGNIVLLEKRNYGYNGYKLVTAETHNTITCVITDLIGLPYLLNNPIGYIKSNIRIVGTTDYERARELFLSTIDATNQTKSWLFVYTLPRITGKDPNGKSDVNVDNYVKSGVFAKLIQSIELCVMINLGDKAETLTLANEKDKVAKYISPICKSIAGFVPSSPFENNVIYQKLTIAGDQQKQSEKGFYSHQFNFETFVAFTQSQEISEYDLVALKKIDFDLKDAENGNLISNIAFAP